MIFTDGDIDVNHDVGVDGVVIWQGEKVFECLKTIPKFKKLTQMDVEQKWEMAISRKRKELSEIRWCQNDQFSQAVSDFWVKNSDFLLGDVNINMFGIFSVDPHPTPTYSAKPGI